MARKALILPAVALAFAGCGGSSSDHKITLPSVKAQPSSPAGGLHVSATDARLGDATVATERGTAELRVRRIVDAAALQRHRHRREGVGAGASCQNVDVMPAPDNMPTVIDATLCLLNGERADAGLAPLSQNSELAQAAIEHSQDMVSNQYFDHVAPDGRDVVDRIRSTGYIPDDRRWTVGENLAWGTGDLATPRNIVTAWMNSQGHRENILRPEFREIGFGVITGNPRSTDGAGATYTTNFGAVDRPAASAATEQVANVTTTTISTRSARTASRHRSSARSRAARLHRRERRLHARATRLAHH